MTYTLAHCEQCTSAFRTEKSRPQIWTLTIQISWKSAPLSRSPLLRRSVGYQAKERMYALDGDAIERYAMYIYIVKG